MRTDHEILARMEERKPFDPLGFEHSDYLCRLPFELAKPWLQDHATAVRRSYASSVTFEREAGYESAPTDAGGYSAANAAGRS